MQMVFGREKARSEAMVIALVRIDAALADCNGAWNAFYAD